jgi:hypothetical protein
MNAKDHSQSTNLAERVLVILLRLSGIGLLTALFPAVMPFAWMDVIHNRLGLGELPNMPIMGYLTRSLSVLYALHGALVFFVSLDVRRYLPVIKCLFVLAILIGAGMLILDLVVGMPRPWAYCEGPSIIILTCIALWLTSKVPQAQPDPRSSPNQGVAKE